jgi:hypothetical protein
MASAAPQRIELNLDRVEQLFNSMDPSPFHAKDLDRDADEFIVSWASEHPIDAPIALRVHLATWPDGDPTTMIRTAVKNHFESRARLAELEFRRHVRDARTSLVIGLVFLAVCLVAIRLVANRAVGWGGYVAEGLTIAGWVAMWRPMQMYLYDWWPLRRKRKRFERLAGMPVEVVAGQPG